MRRSEDIKELWCLQDGGRHQEDSAEVEIHGGIEVFIYSITVTVKERAAEIHLPLKLVSGATMCRF